MWLLLNRGVLLDALLCAALLLLSVAIFDARLLSMEDASSSPIAAESDSVYVSSALDDAVLSWNTRLQLATPAPARHWVFDRNSAVGPQHWPNMVRTCDPALFPQSPIDLHDGAMGAEPSPAVDLVYPAHRLHRSVSLHAHGLEFHAAPGDSIDSFLHVSPMSLWRFDSGHVHLPSDHTLNGGSFPLELHLVHTQDANDTTEAGSQRKASEGPFAVVAVLFKEGRHNPALEPILEAATRVLRASSYGAHRELRDAAMIDLRALVPIGPNDAFWHYNGSLTTPPCLVRGFPVRWHIVRRILELSPAQLGAFRRIMPEPHNNRPVQPLANRTIQLQPLRQATAETPTQLDPATAADTAVMDASPAEGKDGL